MKNDRILVVGLALFIVLSGCKKQEETVSLPQAAVTSSSAASPSQAHKMPISGPSSRKIKTH